MAKNYYGFLLNNSTQYGVTKMLYTTAEQAIDNQEQVMDDNPKYEHLKIVKFDVYKSTDTLDEVLTRQDNCPYCHTPFKKMAVDDETSIGSYIKTDGKQYALNIATLVQQESGLVSSVVTTPEPINFCPKCGRKLGDTDE